LIGLQGFGAEICKNIILAGVKAVTILDGGVVNDEDACSQFLAARDQLGKNVRKQKKLQLSTKRTKLILDCISVNQNFCNVILLHQN
jgi:ubiquitin-like 1-activating enzyme E1 A